MKSFNNENFSRNSKAQRSISKTPKKSFVVDSHEKSKSPAIRGRVHISKGASPTVLKSTSKSRKKSPHYALSLGKEYQKNLEAEYL